MAGTCTKRGSPKRQLGLRLSSFLFVVSKIVWKRPVYTIILHFGQ